MHCCVAHVLHVVHSPVLLTSCSVEVDKLRSFAATMKNKAAAEIEARLAHDAQQKVQIEALMKQLSEAPKLHDAAEFGTAQAAQDALHEVSSLVLQASWHKHVA